MFRTTVRKALLLSIVALAGCGGSGGGSPAPPPGSAFFESAGGGIRMRGRLAFLDGAGNPVAAPAEGAIVLAGTGTRAAGTDSQGFFTIDGLPAGANLRCRAYARGFMPVDFNVAAGATSTDRLQCREDTNSGNNPQLTNQQFVVADDGVVHFMARSQLGTNLAIFASPTTTAKNYTGARGDLLPVIAQQVGEQMSFVGDLGTSIQTGTFFTLLSGPDGVSAFAYGTCQLSIGAYNRAGRVIAATITGPNGVACAGAEVLAWEEGDTANRGSATADGVGRFGLGILSTPTNGVSIQVQWTDPATGIIYVCLFKGNP